MDRLIAAIHDDLKYIRAKTDELARTSAGQSEQLKEYVKRQDELRAEVDSLVEDLRPIQNHVALINAAGKLLIVVLGGGASLAAIIRIVKGF